MVFSAGFAFGVVRTLFVVPQVGPRIAELLEAPLMLLVLVASARVAAGRLGGRRVERMGAGLLAALLVLAADLWVGVRLRGMSVGEVLFDRDPVAGAVYYALVLSMAAMPAVFDGRRPPPGRDDASKRSRA